MKYFKIFGLIAAAVAALMVFVGTASATTVTAPAGSAYTGSIRLLSEGHVAIDNPIAAISCNSEIEVSNIESHGAGVTAKGPLSWFSFFNCTNSWEVTVLSAGSLEFHSTGGGNATVTSSGATLVATRLGITCRYATSNTDIGTVTGAATFTSHATLDISAAIPFHSGSGLCGSGSTTWTGAYKVLNPTGLTFS